MRAALAGMTLDDSIGLVTPHVDLGWQHPFDAFLTGQVLTFQSLAQIFTILGLPLTSDAAVVRTGFDLAIAREAMPSLDYDASLSSRIQHNAIRRLLCLSSKTPKEFGSGFDLTNLLSHSRCNLLLQ
jgi:uncharacterized protein with beta-barrel porin domain